MSYFLIIDKIFLSSASVYGEDVVYRESITENTPAQPKTYYGIAKYSAERILEKVCIDNHTELMILRPPLVYGKDDLSRGYGPTGFTYKAINSEEIILWGDGSEFREFVFITDVAKTIHRLLNNNFNGILNLVSGKSYTFKNIYDLLIKISKSDINAFPITASLFPYAGAVSSNLIFLSKAKFKISSTSSILTFNSLPIFFISPSKITEFIYIFLPKSLLCPSILFSTNTSIDLLIKDSFIRN